LECASVADIGSLLVLSIFTETKTRQVINSLKEADCDHILILGKIL
jgi:transcriptional regulator of met regulon